MGKGHFFAIDGAVEGLGSLLSDPAAGDKTLEYGGHKKCAFWRWKDKKETCS
jgi:hypothetical protein